MSFRALLQTKNVYLDGGMGTLLQEKGLKAGELPETWNLSHPDVIREIHRAYFDAGSNVVSTNTFGANGLKFSVEELEKVIFAAVENAKIARRESQGKQKKYIALDMGPTGKLLEPFGDLSFENAVSLYAEVVRLGVKCGVDAIFIETMSDSLETKAAMVAVKENSHLPVLVSMAFGEDGKLMTGADPDAMVSMLEGLGADAIGANCSLGPEQLQSVTERFLKVASVPVILKPNAGLPVSVNGKTVFQVEAEDFACQVAFAMKKGVRVVGGCCGTTPDYIQKLTENTGDFPCIPVEEKGLSVISSGVQTVYFDKKPVLIGERINPTGKKRLKQALAERDFDYLLSEGFRQQEAGVPVLDVNVGCPEIDEAEMLRETVKRLQGVIDLPLQLDSANPQALEAAMRVYNGKPMVNSVNGKSESMEKVFPLVKKYGGFVVALTLDEQGIPHTAEGRFEIAKKICQVAEGYGIAKKNLIFDPLAMTISADNSAALATLKALRMIKEELGCHTSLGVSNISFGLPQRDFINGCFFAMALENGLSAAIMNPFSTEMMKTYYSACALKGLDDNCMDYIRFAESLTVTQSIAPTAQTTPTSEVNSLVCAIEKGMKERASQLADTLLKETEPLAVVTEHIIPALNRVGEGFENKTVYLPQLLMSAEAAKGAFERIKAVMTKEKAVKSQSVFVLATVQGDIHDIGKNIVKLLMENYGFSVVDLGKDVPPERVLEAVREYNAPLVGLSALMTTTVPAMEKTIRLIKAEFPACRVIVGGAVLTEEYAAKIGADFYAKDAMETVRIAQSLS